MFNPWNIKVKGPFLAPEGTGGPGPEDEGVQLEIPTADSSKILSDSVAASVAVAQQALEDSMNKAQAMQMEAMSQAIQEFKAAQELLTQTVEQVRDLLSQAEDLKAEALELVTALTPQTTTDDGSQEGEGVHQSNIQKPAHIRILKTIL